MARWSLKVAKGDALHAVLRAASFKIQWLLRAITIWSWLPFCWPSLAWPCMQPP